MCATLGDPWADAAWAALNFIEMGFLTVPWHMLVEHVSVPHAVVRGMKCCCPKFCESIERLCKESAQVASCSRLLIAVDSSSLSINSILYAFFYS